MPLLPVAVNTMHLAELVFVSGTQRLATQISDQPMVSILDKAGRLKGPPFTWSIECGPKTSQV